MVKFCMLIHYKKVSKTYSSNETNMYLVNKTTAYCKVIQADRYGVRCVYYDKEHFLWK